MLVRLLAFAGVCAVAAHTAASPLSDVGYSALPVPQHVVLKGREFHIGPNWRLQLDPGIPTNDVSVETLKEDLIGRHNLNLSPAAAGGPAIRLSINPGSVVAGTAQDLDRDALAAQAYQIELNDRGIHIAANASAGLFYGVETLVQLIKHRDGKLWLPNAQITDWPDLQLRELYWDDAHHLERMDALKQAIRQAAFFKINGFAIKLEGHFQFNSAPAIVEPQALSPAQFQELTDYGLKYHVQLIPYLDAPAHVAFILKHPEYAALRAFPDSNYEMCTGNPETYKLLFGLFQDLLDANRGVKYFHLSTDEPYYVGMADNPHCREAARQRELGSPGKALAEFVTNAAGYLHERGRTVIFWGEYPLKPDDVSSLPAYLINGETGPVDLDRACCRHGIRQMFYTSTQGEEKLFPDYFVQPDSRQLHPSADAKPRVESAVATIASDSTRKNADLMGMLVAGWADSGLHPQTFWLGYATIAAAGWNPHSFEADRATADFFRLFYGPSAAGMDRIYRRMSEQAQFWADSWETVPSTHRKGIWGNSNSIFTPRRPARDQILPLPPVPSPGDLSLKSNWAQDNSRRLKLANEFFAENDELLADLHKTLGQAEFNRHNLEVLLSIARICRQNLDLIRGVARMNDSLLAAHKQALTHHPDQALAELDKAIDIAHEIRQTRNQTLRDATATWYKTWLPRVPQANGRRFLHELDDVKDHLPDRTIDMSYLVYRELMLPMAEWVTAARSARNLYARSHGLPERTDPFDWHATD